VKAACGALLLLALAACAGQPTGPTLPSAGGPLHDPAREWENPAAPAPKTASTPGVPAVVYVERDTPEVELRDFRNAELERIRSVQTIVHAASREHGIPHNIINGIIWVESKFLPDARGTKGPRGLMQLMPRTGRAVAKELDRRYDPHDPEFNIHAGTYYYARMLERFGQDPRLALTAYNIGPGVVRRWIDNDEPFAEATQRYVERVFSAAHAFHVRGF
jgi:soluble lytic murein transglycosylase-like protein